MQFVATENPFAMSSLAMPMPMSPMESTPILAKGTAIVSYKLSTPSVYLDIYPRLGYISTVLTVQYRLK